MDILYLLIPLSVVLAFAIGIAFWLAVEGGQFDDLDGPALQILVDDDRPASARTQLIQVNGGRVPQARIEDQTKEGRCSR